jgi:hypothetical protein
MTRCKTLALTLAAVFSASLVYAQTGERGFIGLEAGQTSDRFGGIAPVKGFLGGVEGEVVVINGVSRKEGLPNILLGGEIRFPSETSQHASEFSAFVGPQFRAGGHFSIGFHVQLHKLFVPPGQLEGVTFNRDKMLLLELPVVLEFKSAATHGLFFQLQGSPEFSPRLKSNVAGPPAHPKPTFDYGYTARASLGYILGRWYAKATYQRRNLRFKDTLGNPLDLYNWRSDQITGGFGLTF